MTIYFLYFIFLGVLRSGNNSEKINMNLALLFIFLQIVLFSHV